MTAKPGFGWTAIVIALCVLTLNAFTQDYDVSWYTIDGGGDTWTTGGDFELSGTIGQPDAGGIDQNCLAAGGPDVDAEEVSSL